MSNPFYNSPTTTSADDTSPGGGNTGLVTPGTNGGPTIIDHTYSAGNPFASSAPARQAAVSSEKVNALQKSSEANIAAYQQKAQLGFSDIPKVAAGIPNAIGEVAHQAFTNPLGTSQSILGGLLDAGVSGATLVGKLGTGILQTIYGKGNVPDYPDLPLPGQTMNEYIGNNSDISTAEQNAAKLTAGYEIGGGAAKGIGLGNITTDALGNTITNASLASRVAGNVIGGQLVSDPNATFGDRSKQALFDAAFGTAESIGAKALDSIKAVQKAAAAVSDAKGTIMNSAIDTFENPVNGTVNPDVAAKLRDFLASPEYAKSKNMVDFETNLQKALGDSYNDPKTQEALQPIIDAGHKQVMEALGLNNTPKPNPKAHQPITPMDALDPETLQAKVAAQADKKPAKISYQPKDDLGVDEHGNKRMAITNVDTKTGNAIVQYVKELDANPEAKQIILDHEQGHILDKQLNGGNNLSASLGNYKGNAGELDTAIGGFAKDNGMTTPEAAMKLQNDINVLSGGEGAKNENFADAVAKYRQDPAQAFKDAPTFSKLMEYTPQDGRFTEHSTSVEGLKQQSPVAGQQLEEKVSEIKSDVNQHVESKGNVVASGGKHYELSGDSLQKYTDLKSKYDERIQGYKDELNRTTSASREEYIRKQMKAEGMQFSAAKRELTGDLTQTEINNKVKYEQSNYLGKNVEVEVNGQKVKGTVDSKPSFGNIKVKLEDGTIISSNTNSITDPRSFEEIEKQVTARPESKEYNPYKAVGEEKKITVEQKNNPVVKTETPAEKVSSKTDDTGKFAGTGLDTGKSPETPSFNPDKINAPEDVQKLFDKMDTETNNMSEGRISKSNADIKDLSRLVGMKPEDLVNAKPGSIANSETVTAARQLVVSKASQLSDAIKGIDPETASDAELKDIRDKFLQLKSMQQTVAGFRTEASNTLRSFGIALAPDENFSLKTLLTSLQKMGIASGDDDALFAQKVGKTFDLTTYDKIKQGALKSWYASILSGPATPIHHILGVLSNMVTDIGSTAFNPKTMGEFIPKMSAMFEGLGPAFDEFKNTFKGETPEARAFMERSTDQQPIFTGPLAGYGKAVEFVGKFMNSTASGLTKLAKGVEEAGLKVNSAEISEDVQKALTENYASKMNYLGEPQGNIGRGIMKGSQAAVKEAPILKVIIPFVKVAANILDQQFDYIPGTSFLRATEKGLSDSADRIMLKHGLEGSDVKQAIIGRLHDQQVGRAVFGAAITGAALVAASKGMISGSGPTNYNQKVDLEQTGWQPDSIKIGNMYVPYDYLGPAGGILSIAGNLHDKSAYDQTNGSNSNDISNIITKGLIGWSESQLSRSMLKGPSDLLAAFSGKSNQTNYITNLTAGLLSPLAPKAITGTRAIINAAMGNENQYQTNTVLDKLRAQWGLTGKIGDMPALSPRTDSFGQPLKASVIYGVTPSLQKADIVDNYLTNNDIVVTIPAPGTKYTDPSTGKTRALTSTEYDAYVKGSGKQIYQNLEEMLPTLQSEDVDTQRSEIRSMLDSVRTDVRGQVMNSNNK